LSFVGPLIKTSALFYRKQQIKEAVKFTDMSVGTIVRQPSINMMVSPQSRPQAIVEIEEENEADVALIFDKFPINQKNDINQNNNENNNKDNKIESNNKDNKDNKNENQK